MAKGSKEEIRGNCEGRRGKEMGRVGKRGIRDRRMSGERMW